jgi:hypothetical protein
MEAIVLDEECDVFINEIEIKMEGKKMKLRGLKKF